MLLVSLLQRLSHVQAVFLAIMPSISALNILVCCCTLA